MKALRGTKRVCHACEVRFYDLSRERIVCPSCGAHYVPDAAAMASEAGTRPARSTDKKGWRGRSLNPPDPGPDVAPEVASTEGSNEEAAIPALDDHVLEEDSDEADIPGLVGHHESDDPKEP